MTQHDTVKERIMADIASGALAFGTRLTIDDLSARYAASHMPVREAVRSLQGAGVLETGPGRSARIPVFDPKFVEDLFATRAALETMLVRQAAQLITATGLRQLESIEEALEAQISEQDHTGTLAENHRFHAAINAIADNPEAVGIIDRHWWLIGALWQRVGYVPERFPGVVSDHRHLLRALRRGDVDAAGILMGAHVIKAKFDLLDRMVSSQTATRLRDAS